MKTEKRKEQCLGYHSHILLTKTCKTEVMKQPFLKYRAPLISNAP